jgi:nitrogen fixation protein FixH
MTKVMNTTALNAVKGPHPSDKWIPWYFVAFFVGLAIVNAIFIYIATSTHSGVVTENAYSEGLSYNETIAAVEAQEALGWQSIIQIEGDMLKFELSDGRDKIKSASVIAEFVNPTREGMDFTIDLTETDQGLYEGVIPSNIFGQWDIRVKTIWQQTQYQINKRIVIPT